MSKVEGAVWVAFIVGAVICLGLISRCTADGERSRYDAQKRGQCVCGDTQ